MQKTTNKSNNCIKMGDDENEEDQKILNKKKNLQFNTS